MRGRGLEALLFSHSELPLTFLNVRFRQKQSFAYFGDSCILCGDGVRYEQKQLLPKPQPTAHFYELGLVEDGISEPVRCHVRFPEPLQGHQSRSTPFLVAHQATSLLEHCRSRTPET